MFFYKKHLQFNPQCSIIFSLKKNETLFLVFLSTTNKYTSIKKHQLIKVTTKSPTPCDLRLVVKVKNKRSGAAFHQRGKQANSAVFRFCRNVRVALTLKILRFLGNPQSAHRTFDHSCYSAHKNPTY